MNDRTLWPVRDASHRGIKVRIKAIKKAATVLALLAIIDGCTTDAQPKYMMASDAANYTDKHIDYSLYDTAGAPFGLGGDAKPFNKGGTGAIECCAMLPGPAQPLRVAGRNRRL